MGRRPREEGDPRLTDVELEIMDALWALTEELGEADVAELCARLGEGRAYTTVATLLKILETKGFAASRKDGRRLLYRAVPERPRWQSATVADLVQRVFGGDARSLVRSLLDSGEVDPEELASIRRMLDEQTGKKS